MRTSGQWDVAVVGGGPVGLAVAIHAARHGLSTVVLERDRLPRDKACGEGLLPAGVAALRALGVTSLLPAQDCTPLVGLRYVQEDGTSAEARLPSPGGLGIRRLALSSALLQRAREAGVEVREQSGVTGHQRTAEGYQLQAGASALEARILIAADGLASPLREAEGLSLPTNGPRRFGIRRHFRVAPQDAFVEIHFGPSAEAYVTPAGRGRIGAAILWEREPGTSTSFERLLAGFPVLQRRLAGATPDSEVRGAGPFHHRVRARTRDHFALVGDAGGYLDAITGEGLSLGLDCARFLGALLPEVLAEGGTVASLQPYEHHFAEAYRRYARLTGAVLWLSRHPAVRRRTVAMLGRHPEFFERVLRGAVGPARGSDRAADRGGDAADFRHQGIEFLG